MNNAYETMLEALAGERLDKLFIKRQGYQEAMKEAAESARKLKANLTEEQYTDVEKYLDIQQTMSAMYIESAYRQGIKDAVNILFEIIKNE